MLDTLNAILLAAEQGVRYEDYSICLKVFLILMVVAAVAIIVVIMMQKGTNDNVGVITGAKRYLLRQEQIDQQRKRFEKDHFRTLRFHSRLLDHLLRYVGTYQITRIIKRKYPSGSFFEPFCFSRAKCERIHPFRA